jgi:predicted amidohydrolase
VIPLPIIGEGITPRKRKKKKSIIMDQFRIALAQLEPSLYDKQHNLEKAEQAIHNAAGEGASAILFPELYLTGYSLRERASEMAETIDGPSVRRVAEMAERHHIAVLMGFAERSSDGERVFDAVFIANPQGRIEGSYHKINLFQAEAGIFFPGEKSLVIDFGLGPVGILICYDLEFPEAVRDLALRGAKWIATCTGNMLPNQHLQEIFVQSRAAENHLWVAVANRTGREADLDFFGGSAVSNPSGVLVARAYDQEMLLFADIDLNSADQARLNADYLNDRRPDLYLTKPI